MAILRVDLERALDELVTQEEGMRFQALSVVLGKKRWPELVARQRKKDFGLDAYADASLTPEKVGKGLAASITASIKKVSGDTKTAKEHFPDLAMLLFVTSAKVGNADRRKWEIAIHNEHGVALYLLEREEIITLLMMPENAALCASFLYLNGAAAPQIVELLDRTRRAAAIVTESWAARTKGLPLVELQALELDEEGAETNTVLSLQDIDEALSQSKRIVLEGPAGRGKTTTITQLAQRARVGRTAFVIELPAWTVSHKGILDYLAGMPSFQAQDITAADLARLQQFEGFLFLLNGWNEIAESKSEIAIEALREVERSFPEAGIIVATRAHHLTPPLPGARRLRLLPLKPSQRTAYLSTRLGATASDLRKVIEAQHSLDQLTRSPFILSEVASLFEAGATIPDTKVEVLAAVIRLQEIGEHRNALQGRPLFDCQQLYLEALALELVKLKAVALRDADARAVVTEVGKTLVTRGQIGSVQEPSILLAALTAHHVLERVDYPEKAFRFEHQQFQEYYAALAVDTHLLSLHDDNGEALRQFVAGFVNDPTWAESLRMIAEKLAGLTRRSKANSHSVKAGGRLIRMALSVDPVFASQLARLCGPQVWSDVRVAVGTRLRALYASHDPNYQEYALTAMFATGSVDFRDVIVPLLSAEDRQTRLRTYGLRPAAPFTHLGPNWRDEVRTWNDGARRDFVSEMSGDAVAAFAASDHSVAVKEAVVDRLGWRSPSEHAVTRVLESMDAETFAAYARKHARSVPKALTPKVVVVLRTSLESALPATRLRAALDLISLGERGLDDVLKENVALLSPPGASNPDHLGNVIRPALEYLREADPAWVSEWAAVQIVEGALDNPNLWLTYLIAVPDTVLERYLCRLENEDLGRTQSRYVIAVLLTRANARLAARVFAKLRVLRAQIAAEPDATHDLSWAIVAQLETLFRALPGELAANCILSSSTSTTDPIDLTVATELLDRLGRVNVEPLHIADEELKERLRAYLKAGVQIVLRQNDYYGKQKVSLASCIAQVGLPEDMKDLLTLIRADMIRMRRGRAAKAQGDDGPIGTGSMLIYPHWYVSSVRSLDAEASVTVLIDLLAEPEYTEDVAKVMAEDFLTRSTLSYYLLWAAREGWHVPATDDRRRERFATALTTEIERRLERRSDAQPVGDVQMLATALAAIDGRASSTTVLAGIASPAQWDESVRIEAAERLLMSGVVLPARFAFNIVDGVLSLTGKEENNSLLERALSLCAFVDAPAIGIAKIRDVINQHRLPPSVIRELVIALGQSRAEGAVELLCDLASNAPLFEHGEADFFEAVAALDTPRAREILLSAVDPDLRGFAFTQQIESQLIAQIARYAQSDPKVLMRLQELCDRDLPDRKRHLLSKTLAALHTREASLALMKLIDDGREPPIPAGAQDLHGRANELRRLLFKMQLEDKRRRKSAAKLLAKIERERIKYYHDSTSEARHPDIASGIPWPPATPNWA